jgi:hypothetical protein
LHQWLGGTSLVRSIAVTYVFAFIDMIRSSTFIVTLVLEIFFPLFVFGNTYLPKSLFIILPFISLILLSLSIQVFPTISLLPLVSLNNSTTFTYDPQAQTIFIYYGSQAQTTQPLTFFFLNSIKNSTFTFRSQAQIIRYLTFQSDIIFALFIFYSLFIPLLLMLPSSQLMNPPLTHLSLYFELFWIFYIFQ